MWEKFFFSPVLPAERMDIVHDQDVDGADLLPEIEHLSILKMVDQVVHELFGGGIEDLQARVLAQGRMPDGVHQVRLAQTRSSVDVKRVIGLGRVLGHRDSRGVGELIAVSDNEIVERIVRVQVRVEQHSRFRPAFFGRIALK